MEVVRILVDPSNGIEQDLGAISVGMSQTESRHNQCVERTP